MARVRFRADFDWHPKAGVIIAFKADRKYPDVHSGAIAAARAKGVEVEELEVRRPPAPRVRRRPPAPRVRRRRVKPA